jgi:hypothetical protein
VAFFSAVEGMFKPSSLRTCWLKTPRKLVGATANSKRMERICEEPDVPIMGLMYFIPRAVRIAGNINPRKATLLQRNLIGGFPVENGVDSHYYLMARSGLKRIEKIDACH